jgi:hypothetical protein
LTLFDVPLDVRQKIYRYALVVDRVFVQPFISAKYLADPDRANTHGTPNLAVLRASDRVYREAIPIFYQENTFCIVHPDVLASLRLESPRFRQHFKLIRKVELTLDVRDYQHLSGPFCDDLLKAALALKRQQQQQFNSSALATDHITTATNDAVTRILDLRVQLLATDIRGAHPSIPPTENELRAIHDRSIVNMHNHLWGRTFTFVRQTLQLDEMNLNLHNCSCVDGCCRLAEQVMTWGWAYVWVFGLPKKINIRGTIGDEQDRIMNILMGQRAKGEQPLEQLVDISTMQNVERMESVRWVLRKAWETKTLPLL